MKIAHLLSILGLLALGANVAAADPPGNHDDFTGTYFTSPTPQAAEILQIPGVDPLDPGSTPFITFDCSNLSGHPYRRVAVP